MAREDMKAHIHHFSRFTRLLHAVTISRITITTQFVPAVPDTSTYSARQLLQLEYCYYSRPRIASAIAEDCYILGYFLWPPYVI